MIGPGKMARDVREYDEKNENLDRDDVYQGDAEPAPRRPVAGGIAILMSRCEGPGTDKSSRKERSAHG